MNRSALSPPVCAVLVAAFAALAPPAAAQPARLPERGHAPIEDDLARAPSDSVDRPWAHGVSPEQQQKALKAFAEGNELLRDALFVRAAEKYREALRYWDHPAIHYNLALALVNLDQPVEMYDALEKAMAYGAAPLDQDKFERARGYKLLVEKQLARFDIVCATPGAVVYLDGHPLFTGPGRRQGRIRTGEHTVLAKGNGYAPTQLVDKLGAGEVLRLNLKLFTDHELTRYRRVMPGWVPWTVLGSGVAIAAVGGLLHVQARDDFDEYDRLIGACAEGDPRGGCSSPSVGILGVRNRAENEQTVAIIGYVVGAVAAATGLTLAAFNREEAFRIEPFANARTSAGVSIRGSF